MRAMDRVSALALGAAVLLGLLSRPVSAERQAPGSQPKRLVADVVIKGSNHVSMQQLMLRIKTRPGAEYVPEVVQEDVRTLWGTHRFLNVEATTRNEPDGRVTVYLLIKDYPTLIEEVVYQGAKHLKQDELDKLTGFRKGAPLNPEANRLACQAIVRRLNEDGRPFATCDLLSGAKLGDTKVIFNITEGCKMNLRGVKFSGNQWAESGRLMAQLSTKPSLGIFPTKYHPAGIEADIGKIEEYYKNFGFLDVRVSRGLEMTDDGRDVVVTYYVSEGQRYTVQNAPQVNTKGAVPLEQLEALSKIKAGEYYSQTTVDGDVNNIKDYIVYTARQANVQAVPVFNRDLPGVVQVTYEVDEKPCVTVSNILIQPCESIEFDRWKAIIRYFSVLLSDLSIASQSTQTRAVCEQENPYAEILKLVEEFDYFSVMFPDSSTCPK